MADKICTLILKVDLDCHRCYKKIRKILCKLQDQERISTISYDDRSNAITIVGSLDPHELSCKIRREGGKVIKDIQIMGDGKPAQMAAPPAVSNGEQKSKEMPKEKTPAVADQQRPDPPAPAEKPPALAKPPPPPRREMPAAMPAISEEKKPKQRPAEPEPPVDFLPLAPVQKEMPRERAPPAAKPIQPADVTPMVEIPSWPAPPLEMPSWPAPPVTPVGPCGCPCCEPCYQYQGYDDGVYRYCNCGRVYGHGAQTGARCDGAAGKPYSGVYRGCRLFSDEDPAAACIVM